MGSTAMDSIAWAKWPTGTSNPLDMLLELDFVGADLKILWLWVCCFGCLM